MVQEIRKHKTRYNGFTIKDDNSQTIHWKLARVIEAIQGKDNLVRVVRLKTANGEVLRAITQISPLPIVENDQENN